MRFSSGLAGEALIVVLDGVDRLSQEDLDELLAVQNLEAMALVYDILVPRSRRIHPEYPDVRIVQFVRQYLVRCVVENVSTWAGDVHSRSEACREAACLVAKAWAGEPGWPDIGLDWARELYQSTSDAGVREALETFFYIDGTDAARQEFRRWNNDTVMMGALERIRLL
ncbi:hypothetical protein [Tahibacter amnicola]|uniref:Uncharacterized protein n=1 Tax=Tahibacter amnicola TaxID=2976241 RepID=A0ABY6B8M0_9GAMM|nr:hypothetical protein [Tahibacter amnicola]UXI66428.1 hypothetical protein N4264_16950 [Tahibacter amnicola]